MCLVCMYSSIYVFLDMTVYKNLLCLLGMCSIMPGKWKCAPFAYYFEKVVLVTFLSSLQHRCYKFLRVMTMETELLTL
jgi:hypothetical protein